MGRGEAGEGASVGALQPDPHRHAFAGGDGVDDVDLEVREGCRPRHEVVLQAVAAPTPAHAVARVVPVDQLEGVVDPARRQQAVEAPRHVCGVSGHGDPRAGRPAPTPASTIAAG